MLPFLPYIEASSLVIGRRRTYLKGVLHITSTPPGQQSYEAKFLLRIFLSGSFMTGVNQNKLPKFPFSFTCVIIDESCW